MGSGVMVNPLSDCVAEQIARSPQNAFQAAGYGGHKILEGEQIGRRFVLTCPDAGKSLAQNAGVYCFLREDAERITLPKEQVYTLSGHLAGDLPVQYPRNAGWRCSRGLSSVCAFSRYPTMAVSLTVRFSKSIALNFSAASEVHINQVLSPQKSILVTVKKSVSAGVGFLASR